MENFVDVAIIILLLAATALCIFLIFYLNRITKSVIEIQKEMKTMTEQLSPLLISFTELSEKISGLASDVDTQLQTGKALFNEIKIRVKKILYLEQKIRGGFEGPVLDLINNLTAISKGIGAFWSSYKQK